MKKTVFLTIIILMFTLQLSAWSGVGHPIPYKQPDGSTLMIEVHGDAFFHYNTTMDGCIVVTDADGWMCYGYFGKDGAIANSGVRAVPGASGEIISRSRLIPQDLLRQKMLETYRALVRTPQFTKATDPDKQEIGTKIEGDRYALVILAEYKDIKFQYSQNDFINMLTQKGYSRFGAQGCAADYFNEQFGDKVNFHFDVSPIVTLPENREFYGKNVGTPPNALDKRPEEMITDACKLADPDIDFSKYDADKDGVVDNVFVFFAGSGEEESGDNNCIWSHAYYIHSGAKIDLILDNTRIDRYACTSEITYKKKASGYVPEMTGIGTFCHEYSHTFGLPDFYDTDKDLSGGTAMGLWRTTALMDAGNHNNEKNTPPYYNAIEREMLGLSKPVVLKKNGTYTLEPIHLNGQCFRIDSNNEENEYFLLECRYPEGWDKYCGGQGLLVYHIDRSDRPAGKSELNDNMELTARQRWVQYNEVNCRPDRQCAELIAAVPTSKDPALVFWPQPDLNRIHSSRFKNWDGSLSGINIRNIRAEGKNISFDITFEAKIKGTAYHTTAIIDIEAAQSAKTATVSYAMYGQEQQVCCTVEPYNDNGKRFSVRLEGLKPHTNYVVSVKLDQSEEDISVPIKTLPNAGISHIYMSDKSNRYNDGYFKADAGIALETVTTAIPAETRWYYSGEPVKRAEDHRFHPQKDGQLKAEIIYEDGRKETITKDIRIR